jgi:hypothetical protein
LAGVGFTPSGLHLVIENLKQLVPYLMIGNPMRRQPGGRLSHMNLGLGERIHRHEVLYSPAVGSEEHATPINTGAASARTGVDDKLPLNRRGDTCFLKYDSAFGPTAPMSCDFGRYCAMRSKEPYVRSSQKLAIVAVVDQVLYYFDLVFRGYDA